MSNPSFFQRSELTQTLYAFRREFLVAGIFSMVINLLMLTPTLYMLQVYDRVLSSQSELTLVAMSVLAIFLFAVMSFAEWARSRLLVQAGVRFDGYLSTRVFNASFEANLSPTGISSQRAFFDLTQIRQFLTGNGIFAFFDTPWIPIYMAVLFILHPWLGVVGCVFAVVQASLAWVSQKLTAEPATTSGVASNTANAFLQSKLRNAEVLESMGMVESLVRRWLGLHGSFLESSSRAQQLTHRITAISKFVRYTQQSLSLGVGALLVIDNQLSAGGMIAGNVLMTRALAPLDTLAGTWRSFQAARDAFGRLETLLKAYPERLLGRRNEQPRGEVCLRNVSATAAGRAEPILRNIHFEATPGTVTVVLGASGSGKSTLGRVLVGIWPEVTGEVLLDSLPVGAWDRLDLGPHLGYLPQDIELFDGSIAENIARLGEVDSQMVIEAARSTGLHEAILRFPKGYDTPIGEAGGLLSGGQRQRIGLARAIYGHPALVVLDEPNANLDDVGEAALARAVLQLKSQGKTVVLISHRNSILGVADRVVLMHQGQIQMQGPRDQVLTALSPRIAPPVTPPGATAATA